MKRTLLIAILFLSVWSVQAATIHVPADYTTIQEAIDAAIDGDTVLIADGTYTGAGNNEIDTLGKEITITSENGPGLCIIDCESKARAFNIQNNETRNTIIRDLTIQNGERETCAAILIGPDSSISLINCIIKDCYADYGNAGILVQPGSTSLFDSCIFQDNATGPGLTACGAISCSGSNLEIINCSFFDNYADNNAGVAQFYNSSSATLLDCVFNGNESTQGGALSVFQNSTINIKNCIFTGNIAEEHGAALYLNEDTTVKIETCEFKDNQAGWGGGAISSEDCAFTVDNCEFSNNTCPANYGGAVYCSGDTPALISNSVFDSNSATLGGAVHCWSESHLELDTCTFTNNIANYQSGGAISISVATPYVHECTFQNNSSKYSGGAISLQYSDGNIENNEFLNNHCYGFGGGAISCGTECNTIIGGSISAANTFNGNTSGSGADIYASEIPAGSINISHNSFDSCDTSTYSIWPLEAFDMTGCQFTLTPLTQDVYVSVTGNDENNGLSPDTPFKSLRRALSQVANQPESPVTVHVAAGTYSESVTGDCFPLPMLSNVTIAGAGIDQTVFDAEDNSILFVGNLNDQFTARDLCISNGYYDTGSGVYSNNSNWSFERVALKNNNSRYKGGAIFARSSTAELNHCVIQDNTAGRAGAAYLKDSTFAINNCLITGNTSESSGGALATKNADVTISNCTIAGNTATEDGGSLYTEGSLIPVITNSIIWNNSPNAFAGSVTPDVSYSDVQGFSGGQHNLNVDPVFTSGSSSDYYLSCIEAGQSSDSPCINSGSTMASSVLFAGVPLDQMTTRTDETPDSGTVDMGFHHTSGNTCGTLGCDIYMPQEMYYPGNVCYCDIMVCNPTTDTFTDIPVFVILDVLGELYFAPDFSPFDYYELEIPPGETLIHVLPEFYWPAGAGALSDVHWYAAMTDEEISELFGETGIFTFGWSE